MNIHWGSFVTIQAETGVRPGRDVMRYLTRLSVKEEAMQKIVAVLLICFFIWLPEIAVASDLAHIPGPEELAVMSADQMKTDFNETISVARKAQADYHNTRGRRNALAFVPLVGIVAAGGAFTRTSKLQAYALKLRILKREMIARYPEAWKETKAKWHIDDSYLDK